MKISGRTVAYLFILLSVFLLGGVTFAGAQGFPVNPLPIPVEENGIVEPVTFGTGPVSTFSRSCPIDSFAYQVPPGKRLIVEHATAYASSYIIRRYRSPAQVLLRTDDNDGIRDAQLVAFEAKGFPVAGGGPITYYADPGASVIFEIICPAGTGVDDGVSYRVAFSGRLVPYPHPSTIPTATPPPG
jgi:hypothetical protein